MLVYYVYEYNWNARLQFPITFIIALLSYIKSKRLIFK